MGLYELADRAGIIYEKQGNATSVPTEITLDSREAGKDHIFTAIKGFKTDGHLFIKNAYANGTRNFIVEEMQKVDPDFTRDAAFMVVRDPREAMGLLSRTLYGTPDTHLHMTGITGTKGKTTVTTLLYHLLKNSGETSFFTTIQYKAGEVTGDSERTTMEAYKLQKLLQVAQNAGDKDAVVEVSSHAVTLKRVEGIQWDTGIFTSFSRDHLDLYGTMESYFDAKLDFFRALNHSQKPDKHAVINLDDPKGIDVVNVLNSSVQVITVSQQQKDATYWIEKWNYTENGMTITMKTPDSGSIIMETKMRGEFNVVNITLAVAAAHSRGVDYQDINKTLATFGGVAGRFDVVMTEPFTVIVDYAHTPESLEKILAEGRRITGNRLIVLFGCTGDRDKDKRAIMGEIAYHKADFSILTDDDLYTENPAEIMKMVVSGFEKEHAMADRDYIVIHNRKAAIKKAMEIAEKGDVVILAGMGHEKFQITNSGKEPHSDRETAIQIRKELFNS